MCRSADSWRISPLWEPSFQPFSPTLYIASRRPGQLSAGLQIISVLLYCKLRKLPEFYKLRASLVRRYIRVNRKNISYPGQVYLGGPSQEEQRLRTSSAGYMHFKDKRPLIWGQWCPHFGQSRKRVQEEKGVREATCEQERSKVSTIQLPDSLAEKEN